MAMTNNKTSRRALLGSLAILPAIALLPAPAEATPEPDQIDADAYSREDMDRSFANGQQIATLHMAHAWIDRWYACGGNFGISYNPDGSFRSIMRGVPMEYTWTPTDEGRAVLEPHLWLTEPAHQPGAVKMLEGLLTLVPGLKDAVHEIVGYRLLTADVRPA